MTISREKCLEMVREEDLDWQRGFCLSGETNRYEALINRAYAEGQRDMRDRIIDKLGSYDANKCAQIAASLEVE